MRDLRLDLALVHYPVVNRRGETIGSAVTNLDLHDIARAGRTYGVGTYWVVTPFARQRELARRIIGHWTEGYGSRANPDRCSALAIIRVCSGLDEAVAAMTERWGMRPMLVATCARPGEKEVAFHALRQRLSESRPVLLLFGTAWGLAPELLARADASLPPICGPGDYNHLSVRSAAAIVLDRLLGCRESEGQKTGNKEGCA